MATASDTKDETTQQLFVRTDEVDAGTTISGPSSQKPLSALTPLDGAAATRPKPPPRPLLRRDGSASAPPPPPSQPPPAPPPPPHSGDPTDSLSLPQLRQLVSQFPKAEQHAYAYSYRETESFVVEIDEWFHYTAMEQDREYLLAAREAFEQRWKLYCEAELHQDEASWMEIAESLQLQLVHQLVQDVDADDVSVRQEALGALSYILMGVWSVTAGIEQESDRDADGNRADQHNAVQIAWMHKGADLLLQCGAIEPIYQCLQRILEQPHIETKHLKSSEEGYETIFEDAEYREMSFCMACLYLIIESARNISAEQSTERVRQAFTSLDPPIPVYLVGVIARLRWDESYNIPLMHALQLLWKSLLFTFGTVEEHLLKVQSVLQPRVDPFSADSTNPTLTASPLDYHLFRQEVTSKYPAYNPPLPLIPLEIEQKSMLPVLPSSSRQEVLDGIPGPGNGMASVGSIFHQPVHIATPAPSPPPSPAGPGGKGGKKQNYQTNQNFPFLYPPLDAGSNNIGGKGSTQFQDAMVGRKWEGSDVPASIIEAGELFASRMRMTRAMRQLWEESENFMRYDRGWHGEEFHGKPSDETTKEEELDANSRERLRQVNDFFHRSLSNLQSLVIVMMKVMLTNVQDIAVRNGALQDSQNNPLHRNKSNSNLAQSQTLPMAPPAPRTSELPLEDLDNIRSREISQKAISATVLLLLKWLKASHVLQFEYLTQLLLDSNYIQLTLKYFAHQNLEDLVSFSYDRDDLSLWHYCHFHSDHPPLSPTSPDSPPRSEPDQVDHSSADEAMPPAIQRHRRSPASQDVLAPVPLVVSPEQTINHVGATHPTVDELGNPTGLVPQSPITKYSARQFQTSISLLRVLQKLTRNKSHRILLLVQFKSSQILRRILRVPDPLLRLYVLKLFKSQVPYCGRKWRQSNMRVITAIYLHCRPELRDEWLAGMHDSNIEGDVDEAVPLEWSLRGLTFWWMRRKYPDVMRRKSLRDPKSAGSEQDNEGGQEVEPEERDFFQRELDAIGWGMTATGLGADEDVGFGEEAPGVNGINGSHYYQQQQSYGPQQQNWDQLSGHNNAATGSNVGSDAWS